MIRILFLSLLFSGSFSVSVLAAVWPSKNNWNSKWEDRYSEWVSQKWSRDILSSENSPYGPLKVDCADAVYSMRIIFAFENQLPFAMKDPSGGSRLITNEMSRFDKIADPKVRVREFLKFIFDMGSTQSLPQDTYPVAISRQTVRSGGLILEFEKKHSFTIKRIDPTGQPLLFYSTTRNPGALLMRNSWPSMDWVFPKGVKGPSGIRWFRQPEHLNLSQWEVPGYSDEQYEIPKNQWQNVVTKKLATTTEGREEQLKRLFGDVCEMSKFRVIIVEEALKQNQKIGERCMNRSEFDDLSTPSRDRQLLDAFKDLEKAFKKTRIQSNETEELVAALFSSDASTDELVLNACPIVYRKSNPISLRELRRRLMTSGLSSNPNDNLEQRWGEDFAPSDKARRCPVY
jgi:hypothetical protein